MKRIFQTLLLLLLLLIPVVFVLLPYGLEYGAKRWMLEHGEEGVIVGLENVDFNPLTATLGIYNLKVAVKGEAPLLIPELGLHVSLGPLLRKQIVIAAVSIKGVRLLVKQSGMELLHIGGMLLDKTTQQPEVVEDESSDATPWTFAVKTVRILDTEIRYQDARLDTQLRIDDLKLSQLASYWPGQPAVLAFEGAIDGASISIIGQLFPFAAEPSFDGQLDIDDIQLANYAGFLPPNIGKLNGEYGLKSNLRVHYRETQTLDVQHKGSMALKQIEVESEPANIQNDTLAWDGLLRLQLPLVEGPLELILDGALNLSSLDIQLPNEQGTVRQEELAWNGKLVMKQEVDANEIQLEGVLKATGLATRLEARSLEMAMAETPDLDLTIKQSETGLAFAHDGEVVLQGLTMDTVDVALEKASLQWKGQTVFLQSPSGSSQLDIEGALNSGPLEMSLKPQDMTLGYQMAGWQGDLKLGMQEALETLVLNGGLRLEQLQVDAPKKQYNLVHFDHLLVDKLSIKDPEHIEIQKIGISRLSVGQGKQTEKLLFAEHIAANGVAFSKEKGLDIASLKPKGIKNVTNRDKGGQWNFESLIAALKQGDANESSTPKAEAKVATGSAEETAMPIHIKKIVFEGDNQFQFKDETPSPSFQSNIKVERFEFTDLNSAKPEAISPFEFVAQVDEKAHLNFKGGMAPFAPRLELRVKGLIEGLPLPPLSSYTGKMLGYNLDSGELNADVTLDIKAGQVKGENTLTIQQLDVSPLSAEKMAELNTELSMPLDTALGMLRDKHNTIKLELPIAGAVDDLQVDPSDAINQAVGRALKKGVTTYLSAALFPFGTMLTIMQIAGEQAAKLRLDPIFFEPTTATISGKDKEYLAKISSILEERPEIHIKVCGRAVEADRHALYAKAKAEAEAEAKAKTEAAKNKDKKTKADAAPKPKPISDEQLSALAAQRATVIEQHLTDDHGIKGNRLISCQPLLEKDAQEAKPRTELLL